MSTVAAYMYLCHAAGIYTLVLCLKPGSPAKPTNHTLHAALFGIAAAIQDTQIDLELRARDSLAPADPWPFPEDMWEPNDMQPGVKCARQIPHCASGAPSGRACWLRQIALDHLWLSPETKALLSCYADALPTQRPAVDQHGVLVLAEPPRGADAVAINLQSDGRRDRRRPRGGRQPPRAEAPKHWVCVQLQRSLPLTTLQQPSVETVCLGHQQRIASSRRCAWQSAEAAHVTVQRGDLVRGGLHQGSQQAADVAVPGCGRLLGQHAAPAVGAEEPAGADAAQVPVQTDA